MSDSKSILGKRLSIHKYDTFFCSVANWHISVDLDLSLVPCPVCSKLTPTWYINDHLDRDCSQLHKQDIAKNTPQEAPKEVRSPPQQTPWTQASPQQSSRTQTSPQQNFLRQGSTQQSLLQTSPSKSAPAQQNLLKTGTPTKNESVSCNFQRDVPKAWWSRTIVSFFRSSIWAKRE